MKVLKKTAGIMSIIVISGMLNTISFASKEKITNYKTGEIKGEENTVIVTIPIKNYGKIVYLKLNQDGDYTIIGSKADEVTILVTNSTEKTSKFDEQRYSITEKVEKDRTTKGELLKEIPITKNGYSGNISYTGDTKVVSGELKPEQRKDIVGHNRSNYSEDGYEGTLTSRLTGGTLIPKEEKYVSSNGSYYYKDEQGFSGSLSSYVSQKDINR